MSYRVLIREEAELLYAALYDATCLFLLDNEYDPQILEFSAIRDAIAHLSEMVIGDAERLEDAHKQMEETN